MAESIIGLFKTELIRRRGPWKGIDDVEYATLEWSTGSTTADCSSRSVTFRPRSSRRPTGEGRTHEEPLDSNEPSLR